MFLKSVVGGLAILLHWQVWLALVVYILARFGWLMLVGGIMGRSDSGVRMGAGCLTHMIGGTIFNSLLLGLLVLVLIPIMMGGDSILPFAFFRTLAWPIFKACMYAMVAIILLAIVPIIGSFINGIPGVSDFVQGLIIFRFFSASFIETQLKVADLPTDIYPGLWTTMGYLVIGVVLILGLILGFGMLGIKLRKNQYSFDDSETSIISMAIMPLVGLFPLFMYAKHVSLTIESIIR